MNRQPSISLPNRPAQRVRGSIVNIVDSFEKTIDSNNAVGDCNSQMYLANLAASSISSRRSLSGRPFRLSRLLSREEFNDSVTSKDSFGIEDCDHHETNASAPNPRAAFSSKISELRALFSDNTTTSSKSITQCKEVERSSASLKERPPTPPRNGRSKDNQNDPERSNRPNSSSNIKNDSRQMYSKSPGRRRSSERISSQIKENDVASRKGKSSRTKKTRSSSWSATSRRKSKKFVPPSSENIDIAEKYLECFRSQDVDGCIALTAPGCNFRLIGSQTITLNVETMLTNIHESFSDFSVVNEKPEEVGPGNVVIKDLVAQGTHSGKPFCVGTQPPLAANGVRCVGEPESWTMFIKNGKIVKIINYCMGKSSGPMGFYQQIKEAAFK